MGKQSSLTRDEVEELRALHRLASRVRGRTRADAPERQAAGKLSEMLLAFRRRGITFQHLDEVLRVSPGATGSWLRRQQPPPRTQPASEAIAAAAEELSVASKALDQSAVRSVAQEVELARELSQVAGWLHSLTVDVAGSPHRQEWEPVLELLEGAESGLRDLAGYE